MVYLKKWFLCQLPAEAPRNDLELLKELSQNAKINKSISVAATTTFLRHTWYFSEVMIGLAFFDNNINNETKAAVVVGLDREASVAN